MEAKRTYVPTGYIWTGLDHVWLRAREGARTCMKQLLSTVRCTDPHARQGRRTPRQNYAVVVLTAQIALIWASKQGTVREVLADGTSALGSGSRLLVTDVNAFVGSSLKTCESMAECRGMGGGR